MAPGTNIKPAIIIGILNKNNKPKPNSGDTKDTMLNKLGE
jgi:hypothetical protein